MFEWDEAKRQANLAKHKLDFIDARLLFDGRATITARSDHPVEARFVTTAIIGGKFYTVIWTWRDDSRRIISLRRARDGEERAYRQHTDDELRAMQTRGEGKSDWKAAAALTEAEIEAAIADDPDEAGMVVDWTQASVNCRSLRPSSICALIVTSGIIPASGQGLPDQNQRDLAILCRADADDDKS